MRQGEGPPFAGGGSEKNGRASFLEELGQILRPSERFKSSSFWLGWVLVGVTVVLFEVEGASIWKTKFGSSLFHWLWLAWRDPIFDSAHGAFIPFISLGLVWSKRREILALPAQADWRGIWGVTAALLLHWMGMRGQIPRVSVVALIFLLWSMVWVLQGLPRAKIVSFAFAFLFFMIPMNFLETLVAFPLRLLVAKITWWIGHFLGIAVQLEGTRIFNPIIPYNYDVAAACSGIRSLMVIMMLSVFYGYFTQTNPWKRLVLFASGIPLAIAGNVMRVTCIMLARQIFGEKAAEFVHDSFVYVIFIVVVMLLFMVGSLLDCDYGRLRARWDRWKRYLTSWQEPTH